MLIYHVTDLYSALNIIETKKFRSYSNNIYDGDSGLNSFPTLNGGFNYGQSFNKRGVVLVFDWLGEVEEDIAIKLAPHQMKRDVMYIQGAWRSFIPVNSNSKYLKAIEIMYDEEVINELIEYPLYYDLIPDFFPKIKQKIHDKCYAKIEDWIQGFFKDKTIHISVV